MHVAAPLFISAEDSRRLVGWAEAVAALEKTYSETISIAMTPLRTVARGEGVWLRTLTAVLPSGTFMGLKMINLGRNRGRTYLIALVDQDTGELVCLLDGSDVTAVRTAATSALSVKKLANPGGRIVGVLGSGNEARSHVRALQAVLDMETVKVYSPNPERREQFARIIESELGVACHAMSTAEAAVRDSDVVVAAARSYDEQPVLLGRWLQPGMHVVSIGSTLPEQREADPEVLRKADIIVADVRDEVLHDTGDMLAAAKAGLDVDDKVFSLNDVMRGAVPGRTDASQITLFKSVGAGIQDLTVAELVYRKALEAGVGLRLPLELNVLSR